MINRIKKSFVAFIAFCLCIGVFTSFNVYAQTKSNDIIGAVRSNIPYVQVEIKADNVDKDSISGKIGSSNMELASITPVSEQKMLTYLLIDNSSSMTQSNICPDGSFDALKSALSTFVKEKTDTNNNFAVYSIGLGDAKLLGEAKDSSSASKVADKISALSGKEDGTELNIALDRFYNEAQSKTEEYQIIKIILVTDVSADYSTGIDLSEVRNKYQYNKFPLYLICNTASENSNTYKQLRTLSRESGGEGTVFNYTKNKNASKIINSIYKDMTMGVSACFITDVTRDNNTRELVINLNGNDYTEQVVLDSSADIDAKITANVSVNEGNNAFIFTYKQEGFTGNVPLNKEAANNSSYIITKSGDEEALAVSRVEKASDGSYIVYMKDEIYSGEYDFTFKGINDLSNNANTIEPLKNVEITAKSIFWKFFPFIIIIAVVLVILLGFYIILFSLKRKKNVKTIKELFETQVTETVEERHYIQNVKPAQMNLGRKVNLYFKTGNFPQKHISLNIQSSIIIGRSDICDVYIDDAKMSRQHLAIEYTDGVFMITDLQSANGTFVNGVRVLSRQRLNSGDMIVAGLTSIRIEF